HRANLGVDYLPIVSAREKDVVDQSGSRVDRYWPSEIESVESRVRSEHLNYCLLVSHVSGNRHCYVLVDPVDFLCMFVRDERSHRRPRISGQDDTVMADDSDGGRPLQDLQFSRSLYFRL